MVLAVGAGGFFSLFSSANTTTYTARGVSPVATNPHTPTTPVSGVDQIQQKSSPTLVPTPPTVTPKPAPKPTTTPTPAPVPTPKILAPTPKPVGYTMAQVRTHTDQTSCWTVIGSSVYDLTNYVHAHPGGSQRILSICGGDGTSAFQDQHMGNMRVESVLAQYRLGALN